MLLWGTIFLLAGLAGLYVFGYMPWRDGLNHEPKVTLSFKALLFSPVFILLGGLMLWPGKPAPDPATQLEKPAPVPLRGWLFLGTLVLGPTAGGAYYFWLRSFLRALGYDL